MFTQIKIQGLGPCCGTFDINPSGETTVVGRSQIGKSTLIEALCLCLWGTGLDGRPMHIDAITDDADRAFVDLTTGRGAKLSRSMSRKRKQVRTYTQPGEEVGEEFGTEKGWAKHVLKVLGREIPVGRRKVHAGRLIAVPFAWEELADSTGGGRELRDLLDAILGGGESLRDVVASIMTKAGAELADGDPLKLKEAEEERRKAKLAAERAAGAVEASERSTEAAKAAEHNDGPGAEQTSTARATMAVGAMWKDFGRRTADQAAQAARNEKRALDWDRRKSAIGEAPEHSPQGLRTAEESARQAESRLQGYRHTMGKLQGRLEAFTTSHAAKGDANPGRLKWYLEHPGKCPECVRKWPKADGIVAELEALEGGPAPVEDSGAMKDTKAEIERVAAEITAAETNLKKKFETVRPLRDSRKRLDEWERKGIVLGGRPVLHPAIVQAQPGSTRPTPEEVTEAESTIRQAEQAEGAKRARVAQAESAAKLLRSEKSAKARHDEKVKHLEALVDAVRQAPSERLRRSLEGIGNTGPVSFRLPAEGDGVEVLIDGRIHKRASRGRRIYADLCLRLALRRALKMTWFPIFVDDVQSWSEQWPSTMENVNGQARATPVIYLHTKNVGHSTYKGKPA